MQSSTCKLTLKRILLLDQIILCRIRNRHKTSIHREAILLPLRRNVIMGRPTIPNDQIAGLSAHLHPFEPVVLEPIHAILGEPKPFRRPGRDSRVVGHFAVKLLGYLVAPFADDESAIVGAGGVQVDEPLEACVGWLAKRLMKINSAKSHTAKSGLGRVLVLMRPWFAIFTLASQPQLAQARIEDSLLRKVLAAIRMSMLVSPSHRGQGQAGPSLAELNIDHIEGDDQILVIIHPLKSIDNTQLAADVPDPLFVGNPIRKDHAFFIEDG